MTKYFQITETNEYMKKHYGYCGKYGEGDIVATDRDDSTSFLATDEGGEFACWISKDHATEIAVGMVPLNRRTKDDQLEMYANYIDGANIQHWSDCANAWVGHMYREALCRTGKYRVATPELLRIDAINEELKALDAVNDGMNNAVDDAYADLQDVLYGSTELFIKFGDLTNAQKGALLLANHNEEEFQFRWGATDAWTNLNEPSFSPSAQYRVKPDAEDEREALEDAKEALKSYHERIAALEAELNTLQ